MRAKATLFSLPLVITLAALGFVACGGGDAEAPVQQDRPARAAAADAANDFPSEPIEFPVAPLEGSTKLKLSGKVTDSAGDSVKLKSLVRDPTLLIYLDVDTDDRQNRAVTRWLRRIVQAGRHVGFRIVVLFSADTQPSEVDSWFRKRRMPPQVTWAIDEKGQFAEDSGWDPRSAALIDRSGTVEQLFERTEEWDSRNGVAPKLTADILFRAWQLPDSGPEIDAASMQAAVETVRAEISRQVGTAAENPEATPRLKEKIEHPVYVSLFRPGQTARLRGQAQEGRLADALVAATADALSSELEDGAEDSSPWLEDVAELRIQVDLSGEPGPIVSTGKKALWFLVEPGVHGIVVRGSESDNGEPREGVVLPSEPVSMGMLTPRVRNREEKHDKMFGVACRRAGLGRNDWKKDDVELLRFRSTSFGTMVPGGPAVPIFRGNVLWEGEPSEADILESLRVGGLWLVNTVREDGKFDYEYYPNKDRGSQGYNIVRHAGSVYGLFEMYEFAGSEPALAADQERYIDAAGRAMGYIHEALGKPKDAVEDDRVCLLDARGRCESGSAALTLLTFLGRPSIDHVPEKYRESVYRPGDDALMEGLGLTMLDMIDDRGKVFRRYSQAARGGRVDKEPLYYPGECMLALVRFYEHTGDERWLDGARRIAERQMDWYQRDRFIVPDHWVMQALYRLWRIDKKDRYATSAYAMATHYSSEHYGYVWGFWPDYVGAWRRTNDTPRTTRAGSRSEALRAVVNLAWERGDDATVWEDSLLWAARHLMEQQYTERNSYWVPQLERVHGAYPMGVVDNHCRIDNNQHALVGVVGALHVARRRAGGK